jgi:transglutaminase-like putative cysteine protease
MNEKIRRAIAAVPRACALATVLAAAGAHAVPNDELQWRVSRYSVKYELNDDGSFADTHVLSVKLLSDKAAQSGKESTVTYSTSVQKVDVLEAYTLKADGRHVDVPKGNYQVESNSGLDKGAAAFSDWSTLTLVFPDVAKGDTKVFSYRITATQPMFPGQFSTYESFGRQAAYDDVLIEVDASAAMWARLRVRVNEMKAQPVREHDGRRAMAWQWDNKQPEVETRRDWSVYDSDLDVGVAVSTFAGYGDVARAYGVAARPKAAVTPRIRKLADEIAKDARTRRDTTQALYTWVARNITYAGNCVGLGAVVPRDVDFVLDNRMGDCKDHATLLQALLAARDIPSSQALINAGSSYKLPAIPVVSMVNHVIDYVPEFDLYLDSTSDSTPFGMLPGSDYDKPTLLVDGYRDGTRTQRSGGRSEEVVKTVVDIREDGSAHGEVSITTKGPIGAQSRAMLRDVDKKTQADLVKNYFKAAGFAASGVFTMDDPAELLDTHRYGITFDVAGVFNIPGSGAFNVGPMFSAPVQIAGLVGAEVQRQPEAVLTTCSGIHVVEDLTYRFPKTVQVVFTPQALTVNEGDFTYTASYVRSDNQLVVKRTLDDRTPGRLCTPETMATLHRFAQKVMPNLRAQVVYQ